VINTFYIPSKQRTTILTFLDKLLFYSVISSYHVKWELDKIKKTCTVSVRGELLQQEKLPDVIGVELVLFLQDLEFVVDIIFAVGDPCFNVYFCLKD